MPVASLSRCCIICNTSLPCRATRLKSSSSADTPSAIIPPLRILLFAGSGYISFAKRSRTSVKGFISAASSCMRSSSDDSKSALSVSVAVSEFFNCTNSRGRTRPAAIRDDKRSKSPICEIYSRKEAAKSAFCVRYSTIS